MADFKIDLKDLNLKTINELLIKVDDLLTKQLPIARIAEVTYQLRFDKILLDGAFGNQGQREAHARSTCNFEKLYMPMLEAKGELRMLLNKRDILIEISRNLRHLLTNY